MRPDPGSVIQNPDVTGGCRQAKPSSGWNARLRSRSRPHTRPSRFRFLISLCPKGGSKGVYLQAQMEQGAECILVITMQQNRWSAFSFSPWLTEVVARMLSIKAAVALANKLARALSLFWRKSGRSSSSISKNRTFYPRRRQALLSYHSQASTSVTWPRRCRGDKNE